MGFKTHKSNVRTIRKGDPLFFIKDGFVLYPRAGFHILPSCPNTYRDVITESIERGWLKPVAYMRDYEMTFEALSTPEVTEEDDG
jgi:hypothetical protein